MNKNTTLAEINGLILKNDVLILVGQSGYGKTYSVCNAINHMEAIGYLNVLVTTIPDNYYNYCSTIVNKTIHSELEDFTEFSTEYHQIIDTGKLDFNSTGFPWMVEKIKQFDQDLEANNKHAILYLDDCPLFFPNPILDFLAVSKFKCIKVVVTCTVIEDCIHAEKFTVYKLPFLAN